MERAHGSIAPAPDTGERDEESTAVMQALLAPEADRSPAGE